jgi:hypothetical protein
MKIELRIDKTRNFLALIHNLNRDNNPQKYEVENIFKDYRIPKEKRKEIRNLIAKEKDTSQALAKDPLLREIFNKNEEAWEKYWEKNKPYLNKLAKRLVLLADNFEESSLAPCARFFKTELPPRIIIYICVGAINACGRGTQMSALREEPVFILFPRAFNKSTEETIKADFAVMIHEIVHALQQEIYDKEDRDFIEAVTRAFAPRGLLVNEEIVDSGSIEEKMLPLIRKAIGNNQTYFDIKEELINTYWGFKNDARN